MYVVGVWRLLGFSVGSRHAGNALVRFGPGFCRGCVRRGAQGVNPAVSRRTGAQARPGTSERVIACKNRDIYGF